MAALCQHVHEEHEPSHSGIETVTFSNIEEVHTLLTLSICSEYYMYSGKLIPESCSSS